MNETFSASGFKRIRLRERESGRVRKPLFYRVCSKERKGCPVEKRFFKWKSEFCLGMYYRQERLYRVK